MMFLLMVRVTDPLLPRAIFGVLNTLLYFPSGAVYPQQGFPAWMQVIAAVDPFTYAVHAFKSLLLKNTGFGAIGGDLAVPADLLGRRDDRGDAAVQADAVSRDADAIAKRASGCCEAAARLFAERGFKKVTVRDICRAARANVAAVNYHFGDKLGLYREVLQEAIAVMRETSEESMRAADDASAEERIRNYIRVYVRNIVGRGRDSWIHRIMQHEQQDPTPALDMVVEQAIRPRIIYLCGCVAELLGCGPMEDRVLLAVASIQGQCLIYLHTAISARLIPGAKGESFDIETLANHIAEFSLAGLRGMALPGGGLGEPVLRS